MINVNKIHWQHCKVLRKRLCFLLIIYYAVSYAQNESSNWYFGRKAGINFGDFGVKSIMNGELSTNEGCASISNKDGDLLFYTDGITVWDRNHKIMPNGRGLLGHASSTQSAIIVPKPNSDAIYYIFTVTDVGNPDGLRYSEVDLNLNSGSGDITSNKNVTLFTPCSEKITAVHHANGIDFWVIAHGWNNNEFLVFRVTEEGVSGNPVKVAQGSDHGGNINNSHGYMKVSPNGKKIAIAKWYLDSFVEVFDFDSRTGNISNPIKIEGVFENDGKNGAYGVEFSPNSKLLYVTDLNIGRFSSKLHQFNLELENKEAIINSDEIVYKGGSMLSALQLAQDGKIYAVNSYTEFLDVIEDPNAAGLDCKHDLMAINLGDRLANFGLPQFVQSYFVGSILADDICYGNDIQISLGTDQPVNEIIWELGDGNVVTAEESFYHFYEKPGVYNVKASIKSGYNTYYFHKCIEVFGNPEIDANPNWFLCNNETETIYLNSVHDAYLWSTGETTSTIEVHEAGLYTVTVFNRDSDSNIICENSMELRVLESGAATIKSIQIEDWTTDRNSIQIHVEGNGNYEYALNNETYVDSNQFEDLKSGDYTVYVRDKHGCGIITQDVFILNYPKFFTPNGDGYHDSWRIHPTQMEHDMTVYIYDRYGQLIKQLNPSTLYWDGSSNGNLYPSDDYWFVVNRPSKSKQYKGHFTLKR